MNGKKNTANNKISSFENPQTLRVGMEYLFISEKSNGKKFAKSVKLVGYTSNPYQVIVVDSNFDNNNPFKVFRNDIFAKNNQTLDNGDSSK